MGELRNHYYIATQGGKLKEITAAEAEQIQEENKRLISTTGSINEIMAAWEKVQFVMQF